MQGDSYPFRKQYPDKHIFAGEPALLCSSTAKVWQRKCNGSTEEVLRFSREVINKCKGSVYAATRIWASIWFENPSRKFT